MRTKQKIIALLFGMVIWAAAPMASAQVYIYPRVRRVGVFMLWAGDKYRRVQKRLWDWAFLFRATTLHTNNHLRHVKVGYDYRPYYSW